MKTKVLITGSTGFLGTAICKQLLADGYALRCHFRRVSQLNKLKAQLQVQDGTHSIEYIQQDLARVTSDELREMVEGCDAIVHNAAYVRDWGSLKKASAMNVDSTRHLLETAIAVGVQRFVYISSIVVHGLKSAHNITEKAPYNHLYNVYSVSKMRAEQAIQNVSERARWNNFIIIRPASIYGSLDENIYYKVFTAIKKRLLPYIGTKHSLIPLAHSTDVARAVSCSLAASENALGEAYNIVSESVEFCQLFEYIASQFNVKPPVIVFPTILAVLVAWLTNGFRFLFHIPFEPIVTMFRIRSMISKRSFDITKARMLLGFDPKIGWKEGFAESIDEYQKSHG